uniref:Uncharacterized protein n=1 Tax=Arundo donax TaxID=35708 RepID=A0A0A9HUI5_ARUDO
MSGSLDRNTAASAAASSGTDPIVLAAAGEAIDYAWGV